MDDMAELNHRRPPHPPHPRSTMSDTTLTEALAGVIGREYQAAAMADGIPAPLALARILEREVLAARLAEHARILADVRALAEEWNAGVVPYEPHAAALRVVLDGQAPTQEVTSVEDGCTCGGMAACPQCQDRDAGQAPTQAEEEAESIIASLRARLDAVSDLADHLTGNEAAPLIREALNGYTPTPTPARDTDQEGGA